MRPALIFDLDGTLLDSRESILSSIEYSLSRLGRKEQVDHKKAIRQDLWTTLRETSEKYGTHFSDEERFRFIQYYRNHQKVNTTTVMKLYANVPEVLRELSQSFLLAIATTKTTDQAVHILKEFELDFFFSHIQGTDRGLKYKPAPDILLRVLEKLDTKAEHSTYIGDSPSDLLSAKNAGMRSIGAVYGYSDHKELESHSPSWLINRIDEILGLKADLMRPS